MKKMYCHIGFCWIFLLSNHGFSKESVTCSFRDSQNTYREFMVKADGDQYVDADKVNGPFWKVMSDDNNKLILFKEIRNTGVPTGKSVHTVFYIDRESGDFRYRNYIETEYINTVRGECRFKKHSD